MTPEELLKEPSLAKSQEKVQALYDAITTVQADDLACSYFYTQNLATLHRLGRSCDLVIGKIAEDLP